MLLLPGFLLFISSLSNFRNTKLLGELKHELTVEKGSAKQRLDQFIVTLLPNLSRSSIGNLCDQGLVLVNDKPRAKNYKVVHSDIIKLSIITRNISKVSPENIPLEILYEDEHIIAVNKPPGMVVHPAPGSPNGTFVNALLYYLGDEISSRLLQSEDVPSTTAGSAVESGVQVEVEVESQNKMKTGRISSSSIKDKLSSYIGNSDDEEIPYIDGYSLDDNDDDALDDEDLSDDLSSEDESVVAAQSKDSPMSLRPGVVHRLDKGTSGVLLAGKHPEAVAKLSALFSSRRIRKLYLAVCVGNPGEATVVEPIGRCRVNRQLMAVYDGPPGKPSTTHFRTIAFDGKLSTVLARIETGRTHQIRVHLKFRRTPVIGDNEYGAADWNRKLAKYSRVTRPLLHAYETQFIHPFTGEDVTIRAPVPEDMRKQIVAMTYPTRSIIDEETRFLSVSTEVVGRQPGEANRGLTSLESLRLDEDDFSNYELPEDPKIFGFE